MADLTIFYRDGDRVTGRATAAITGARLVKVSGARADGENIDVATAGAGDVVFGVSGQDAVQGDSLPVIRKGVVGLKASENVAAGEQVTVAANGEVQVLGVSEVAMGIAVDDIASGATGPVALKL